VHLCIISVEDYAWALVDELEKENHHKERFRNVH
jgi:putative NADH-flavin reductase